MFTDTIFLQLEELVKSSDYGFHDRVHYHCAHEVTLFFCLDSDPSIEYTLLFGEERQYVVCLCLLLQLFDRHHFLPVLVLGYDLLDLVPESDQLLILPQFDRLSWDELFLIWPETTDTALSSSNGLVIFIHEAFSYCEDVVWSQMIFISAIEDSIFLS